MSKICTKTSCPNRVIIGRNWDKDAINLICPRCRGLYFQSKIRTATVKKNNRFLFFMILVLGLATTLWMNYESLMLAIAPVRENSAENTLRKFFTQINDLNYEGAYQLTNHAKWSTLQDFKKNLQYWKQLEINSITGKSYYSRYDADTIINVVYNGIEDESLVRSERNYDYHLKKYNNDWKIVRIYFPKNPEVDALKDNEIPETTIETVNTFLGFLNNNKYKKAFLLTKNPNWGSESEFISPDGWGCISQIDVFSVKKIETISDELEIVYAKYNAKDPCNGSSVYELYFYVSNQNDYWKIIKAKQDYDPRANMSQ